MDGWINPEMLCIGVQSERSRKGRISLASS
jgi:hypothetical protein